MVVGSGRSLPRLSEICRMATLKVLVGALPVVLVGAAVDGASEGSGDLTTDWLGAGVVSAEPGPSAAHEKRPPAATKRARENATVRRDMRPILRYSAVLPRRVGRDGWRRSPPVRVLFWIALTLAFREAERPGFLEVAAF